MIFTGGRQTAPGEAVEFTLTQGRPTGRAE